MVKTDFVLSYLTDTVNDEILDKLVNDKEIDFTISSPDAYWSKQQIKDSYKTPTGSYNKDAFTEDYNKLSQKYENFQLRKFGEKFLESSTVPLFQEGGVFLPTAKTKKDSISQEEYNNSAQSEVGDHTRPSMKGFGSYKVWNGRAVNTQAGVKFVPDQYTTFTREEGFVNLAKNKSINELAELNQGVLDEKGNLITENLWDKMFESKYITVDESGRYQERQASSGQNLALDLKKGFTADGMTEVLDKVTVGESLFGARKQDDYHWKNRSWYEKILPSGKLIGEGLLKGGWNMVMGIPSGITSMAITLGTTDESKMPDWLIDTNTFLQTQQLRSDVATDEAKWYSAQGLTSGIASGLGQLGAIAAYTAAAVKLNSKLKINEVLYARGLNMSTAIGFGLWGAEDVATEMEAQGNTSANQRKAVQASTFLLLTGVGSVTNIFLSKLEPNVKKQLIKDAVRTGLKDVEPLLANLSTDKAVATASKSIYNHFNKNVSALMSKANKLTKTGVFIDATKEFTQEMSEEIIPDATMVLFPRLYNTVVDSVGGTEEDKFTFNPYGDETYMDMLEGKTIQNYFTAGVFGGITGGIASGIHNRGKRDEEVSYISALTSGGDDWSKENVEKAYTNILNQINREYKNGNAGPTTLGLDRINLQNTVITEDNKDKVDSYADLIKTQAINDLNIAKKTVETLSSKGGFLEQFKTKWDEVNKTTENVEQFNKFALSEVEKRSVNSYLMSEFKSLLEGQATFAKTDKKLELIKERNQFLASQDFENAQKIQREIMGIGESSKRKAPSVETELDKINLLDQGIAESMEATQQRLTDLTNGASFVRGMQQAFVRSQVNNIRQGSTGRFEYSAPLDAFGITRDTNVGRSEKAKVSKGKKIVGSTFWEKMNHFNTLNMTSETYIKAKNEEIQVEIDRIKEANKPVLDNISELENELKTIEEGEEYANDQKRFSEISESFEETGTLTPEEEQELGELQAKAEELGELKSKIQDLKTKVLVTPDTLESQPHPYLNRLDTEKFVSLDSTIEAYVNQAKAKALDPVTNTLSNSDFLDGNLGKIIKELQIRLSQVELNYGSNRKMADFEREVIPVMSELLGTDKADVLESYKLSNSKVKPINYGAKTKEGKQPKLDRDGSKSFLSIDDEQTYNELKSKLNELMGVARELKILSDSNTPDINLSRMSDDLTHIKGQFELFKEIFNGSAEIEKAIAEITLLYDKDEKLSSSTTQDLLNKYISLLNDQEFKVHQELALNPEGEVQTSINKILEKFSTEPMQHGYNKDQFKSFVRNVKNNDVHIFYSEFGAELGSMTRVPSFTQLEAIKHTYWNLKNNEDVEGSTTVFKNSSAVWAYQGAGKTTVVATMVTKLYKRHLASRTFSKASTNKDITRALTGFVFTGKKVAYGKGFAHLFSQMNDEGTALEYKIVSEGKVHKWKDEVGAIDINNVMLAATTPNRVDALAEEFRAAGINHTRANDGDKEGAEISTHKDIISHLIDEIEQVGDNSVHEFIVIDESTLLTGEHLNRLNNVLIKINKGTPKIKVLFLGDLKQAGEPTGFQGTIDSFETSIVDGVPTYTVNTDERSTPWMSDSTKELKVRFRTGNQTTNKNIDLLRDKKYKDNEVYLESEYYQGRDGLKGFKVSKSAVFELDDMVQHINNNKIAKTDVFVITTSEEMVKQIEAEYPTLKGIVKLVSQVQGRTIKYAVIIPDPDFTYAYSIGDAKNIGPHRISTNPNAEGVSLGNKIRSDFYNRGGSSSRDIATGTSTLNLEYQLAFEMISAIGRTSEYTCVVLTNPPSGDGLGRLAETGKSNSKSSIKDIFSFTPLKANSIKTNKDKMKELVKVESKKFTGSFTDTEKETPTASAEANEETAPENEETDGSQIINEAPGFKVNYESDGKMTVSKDGEVIYETEGIIKSIYLKEKELIIPEEVNGEYLESSPPLNMKGILQIDVVEDPLHEPEPTTLTFFVTDKKVVKPLPRTIIIDNGFEHQKEMFTYENNSFKKCKA